MNETSEPTTHTTEPPLTTAESQPTRTARPIGELVDLPDFPQCAVGQLVDIRGLVGVVSGVVNNSLKVKSDEGDHMSYNFHVLKKLYGRPPEVPKMEMRESAPPETPTRRAPEPEPESATAPEPAPKREVIENPDFSREVKSVGEFVGRTDFPKCVFGEHLDMGGYVGVAIEIVNQSIRVASQEGTSRKYNAHALRKLHAK